MVCLIVNSATNNYGSIYLANIGGLGIENNLNQSAMTAPFPKFDISLY